MNSYAMEQITRERVADWHREAEDELRVRPPLTRDPQVRLEGPRVRFAEQPGAGLLASLRRFAVRLVTAA
jgi:hypothetical protein